MVSEISAKLDASIQRNKLGIRLLATAIIFFGIGWMSLSVDRFMLAAVLGAMYVIAVLR